MLAALPAPLFARANDASVTAESFELAGEGRTPAIFFSDEDAPVVGIAARALARDIALVSGVTPAVSTKAPQGKTVVIAGTLGKSPIIDRLVTGGRLDVGGIKGQFEGYTIAVVDAPALGIDRALVIAGADRRGTAYGLFRVSQMIGVSPWVWWSDAKPTHRDRIDLPAQAIVQGSPSVRYRGLFINDEDWSIRPWAGQTLDPSGNIGPATYAHVFELLLRLRANFLWPAMHKVTVGFNQIHENAELADRYAIVMGASHAEPMLRNNVAEWNFDQRGQYNYHINGAQVLDYWDERVKANGQYENVYTVGMRGIHDSAVVAGQNVDEVKLLEQIVADQRSLFKKDMHVAPETVPQIFVPYKEVLDIYRQGMKLPDDITLAWVDDNHGYIRQLSNSAERKRPGGGGVYYHISYWGTPNDYLWLDSTPPALIGEEMGKAWDTNARRVWVLNVGDIKPGEKGLSYFMDLAYDHDATAKLGQRGWLEKWATDTFGPDQSKAIASLLGDYYRLNYARKPEHMGFNNEELLVRNTEFSPVAYGDEAGRRLAAYRDLDRRAAAISASLPADKRDGFYELVQYPVRGSALLNQKILDADRSFLYAHQGRQSANLYADEALASYRKVKQATDAYNAIGDGKWRHFMNDAPRDQAVFFTPPVGRVAAQAGPGLGIAVEGSVDALSARPAEAEAIADYRLRTNKWRTKDSPRDTLPTFERATGARHFVDVFNTGAGKLAFSARPSAPWIKVDQTEQHLGGDKRLWVSIDWSKLTPGQRAQGRIVISGAGSTQTIAVNARNDAAPAGMLVEDDGIVAFSADRFTANSSSAIGGWQRMPDLGRSGHALATRAEAPSFDDASAAPFVDYRFRSSSSGPATVRAALVPTFPLNEEHKLRYAVSMDGGAARIVDVEGGKDWDDAVQRASTVSKTDWQLAKPGEHMLRVYALDPGLVLDSLVIDFGGLKTAYDAPPETIAR